MQRLKQFASANTFIDKIVRKIRNPLNALLLNIDVEANVHYGKAIRNFRNQLRE